MSSGSAGARAAARRALALALVAACAPACRRRRDGAPHGVAPAAGARSDRAAVHAPDAAVAARCEPTGARATQLACGARHCCARMSDATLECWGANDFGQLGLGVDPRAVPRRVFGLNGGFVSADWRAVPVRVGALGRVAQVAASGESTCVRLEDGTVRCFGASGAGQLGAPVADSPTRPMIYGDDSVVLQRRYRAEPRRVLGVENALELVPGPLPFYCARLGPRDAPREDAAPRAVAAGSTVVCWGAASEQPDLPADTPPEVTAPRVMAGLEGALALGAWLGVVCASTATRGVRCVQYDPAHPLLPAPPALPTLAGATALFFTRSAVCGVLPDGHTRCARSRGRGAAAPPADALLGEVRGYVLGNAECAWDSEGRLARWGDEHDERENVDEPALVSGLGPVVDVRSGEWFSCALLADGGVRCWGLNNAGQLGDCTRRNTWTPSAVALQ